MTAYNQIFTFGGSSFKLGDVTPTQKPTTLKTNLGKSLIQKQIPLRDGVDTVLSIQGVITGLSRTSAQTRAVAIEVDRTALLSLEDGTYHAYADGRHSGNFVIVPGSLSFPDPADRKEGEPIIFTMELISW